ncbi:MAG: hypothetical protein HZB65_00505 [Candidatus Aenigmarchaeota archaeon]|nr:hypothetical protein [Candidatus Aenigmarchaeota archaeon]
MKTEEKIRYIIGLRSQNNGVVEYSANNVSVVVIHMNKYAHERNISALASGDRILVYDSDELKTMEFNAITETTKKGLGAKNKDGKHYQRLQPASIENAIGQGFVAGIENVAFEEILTCGIDQLGALPIKYFAEKSGFSLDEIKKHVLGKGEPAHSLYYDILRAKGDYSPVLLYPLTMYKKMLMQQLNTMSETRDALHKYSCVLAYLFSDAGIKDFHEALDKTSGEEEKIIELADDLSDYLDYGVSGSFAEEFVKNMRKRIADEKKTSVERIAQTVKKAGDLHKSIIDVPRTAHVEELIEYIKIYNPKISEKLDKLKSCFGKVKTKLKKGLYAPRFEPGAIIVANGCIGIELTASFDRNACERAMKTTDNECQHLGEKCVTMLGKYAMLLDEADIRDKLKSVDEIIGIAEKL